MSAKTSLVSGSPVPKVQPSTARTSPQQQPPHIRPAPACSKLRPHCNNLWSLWYGVAATGVQAMMIAACMRRFAVYASLPWPENQPSPKLELNAYLGLVGVATLVLPFFLVSSIFKVGNLANDGFKLGHHLSTCSQDPPGLLPGPGLSGGGMCTSLWKHGGPTAPFLHLIASFCLLLPKLIIEAKLIQAGFLPKTDVWHTDLDYILPHRDQLIILNFIASSVPINVSLPLFPGSSLPPLPTIPPTPSAPLQNLETFNLGSISPEYLNYAIALAIFAIRYPAVFWKTNKCFGTLFSIQLFIAGIHSLVTYCGISVLYKIQVCYGNENNPKQGLLLDDKITLALYALSGILVICSSLVMYLHGYCKFSAFINRERAKRGEITTENREVAWGYFPHCAALCVLIASAVVYAPLLHDSALIYRGTLDTSLLACVIASIGYLFLWVVTWLLLTVKRHWTFKLRVTIGRAALRSARSIKLVTDVDLKQNGEANAPLLVVGNGRTYTVAESSPKKAIMAVIQRTTLTERKVRVSEEQIYWLRPNRTPTPKHSPDSEKVNWMGKKSGGTKHKVTFEDACSSKKGKCGKVKGRMKGRRGSDSEDDGDYATLRELPMSSRGGEQSDDTASEENKLLECVRDDNVTYASAHNSELLRPLDESPASSILLLPDPTPVLTDPQFQGSVTPRCLRRSDSGVPIDEEVPRSESVSPASCSAAGSGSPPENSNSSETSSGVHSNSDSSAAMQHHLKHRSVEDLTTNIIENPTANNKWRSFSLQRGIQPPTTTTNYGFLPAPCIEPAIPETTVVIRRKPSRPKTTDLTQTNEPFERSTNMRMTSFTDLPDHKNDILPEIHSVAPAGYCHSFPRVMPMASFQHAEMDGSRTLPSHPETVVRVIPENPYGGFPRPHTTIPTHHNGVRLFPQGQQQQQQPHQVIYASKRMILNPQPNRVIHENPHHTFPHIAAVKYNPIPNPACQMVAKQDRDSANYSMASSGDSDTYVQHN